MILTRTEKMVTGLALMIALVTYLLGMARIGIMDIDASLYAEMARELLKSGDFFEIRNRIIENYLDKPPLIFWSAAASYYLFGIHEFAYRLPTFLTTLLGLWSVYRFARIYYDRDTALTAMLILLSCQAWFLINHDVRTDTMLANFVIFATWQLAAYLEKKSVIHFILGFAGIGLAMLAKGPIGLMIPVIGIGMHLLLKGEWNKIFQPAWLAAPLIILIVLSPMIYSLYRQFGTYGLEFYFWTQSFGRITGENYWQDQSGPFFFVHTFAWSFLPWSILTISSLIMAAHLLIRRKGNLQKTPEFITPAGFIVAFIILSMSSYKLPHYIYVVFPYASIFTAAYAIRLIRGKLPDFQRKVINGIQYFMAVLIPVAILAIIVISFPFTNWIWWAVVVAVLCLLAFMVIKLTSRERRWFFASLFAILFANFMLNLYIYPNIMKYQADVAIASFIRSENIDEQKLYQMDYHSSAFDFQSGLTVPGINVRKLERISERSNLFVITTNAGREKIQANGIKYDVVGEFDYYPIQILTLKFLNKNTRESALKHLYVLKILKKGE